MTPNAERGKVSCEVVEVAPLAGEAVDADDDVLGIGRPPFDIADLVETRLRQTENGTASVRLRGLEAPSIGRCRCCSVISGSPGPFEDNEGLCLVRCLEDMWGDLAASQARRRASGA